MHSDQPSEQATGQAQLDHGPPEEGAARAVQWNQETSEWPLASKHPTTAFAPTSPSGPSPAVAREALRETVLAEMSLLGNVMTPYDLSAASDLLCVPNNALRYELHELYRILYHMTMRENSLTHADVGKFFLWWSTFKSMAISIFVVEESNFFPWIDRQISIEETELSKSCRQQAKLRIVRYLSFCDNLTIPAVLANRAEFLAALKVSADQLTSHMVSYCRRKEVILEPIITALYSRTEILQAHADLVKVISERPDGVAIVYLMSHWLRRVRFFEAWQGKTLGRMLAPKRLVQARVYREHLSITKALTSSKPDFLPAQWRTRTKGKK